ncbi:hypothetical protein ACFVXC_05640 [Streptomyces sp. NPDC058257]|uniref:hypothetical protein n=1 Tax=Streptomyces sp. NPDC058257 TaxID=3346409 RepID=UPI0036E51BE5
MPEAASVGTDWRLLGCAYVRFFITNDKVNQRLLESHPFDLSASVGRLAFTVIEEVLFPEVFGVETNSSYREVDSLRRRDAEFGAAWLRRVRYRRQGLGLTLRPIRRSRHVAADIARMLCASWAHQHSPHHPTVKVCDIVPVMLDDLRSGLCCSSEYPTDP